MTKAVISALRKVRFGLSFILGKIGNDAAQWRAANNLTKARRAQSARPLPQPG
jgi:hypothetical protein